jgi:hypothetical protein
MDIKDKSRRKCACDPTRTVQTLSSCRSCLQGGTSPIVWYCCDWENFMAFFSLRPFLVIAPRHCRLVPFPAKRLKGSELCHRLPIIWYKAFLDCVECPYDGVYSQKVREMVFWWSCSRSERAAFYLQLDRVVVRWITGKSSWSIPEVILGSCCSRSRSHHHKHRLSTTIAIAFFCI